MAGVSNQIIKFNAKIRKLNRQYDIQLAVIKTQLFVDTLPRNMIRENEDSIFGVDSASHPIAFTFMTVSRMTLT